MEIKKRTMYTITFDKVDERINIDGVENYQYVPSHFIVAESKEMAIEYAKSIIEEVKEMHLTNSKGEEFSLMKNGYSKSVNDYETANKRGFYWFYLCTPPTTDKYGCVRYTTAIEVNINKIEVTEII